MSSYPFEEGFFIHKFPILRESSFNLTRERGGGGKDGDIEGGSENFTHPKGGL